MRYITKILKLKIGLINDHCWTATECSVVLLVVFTDGNLAYFTLSSKKDDSV